MVIFQSLGAGASFVDEDEAKAEIQRVEGENHAIRKAVLAKVAVSRQPTKDKKREEALQKVMDENPSFEDAVNSALFALMRQFR